MTVLPLAGDSSSPAPLAEVCERASVQVNALLAAEPLTDRVRRVQEQTRISLGVISEALDRYSLSELSLSYNGGKDCLVLLILYLAVIHNKISSSSASSMSTPSTNGSSSIPPGTSRHISQHPRTLQSVYIQAQHPFPEVETFVAESEAAYSLSLVRYAKPMKAAFAEYLSDFPSVRAIFVGTRRTDPHGSNLEHFQMTDHGWPSFMRIHPVIDWQYADIWTFIRHLQIAYCDLYDRGYTSLGGVDDTHPNPALRRQEPKEGESTKGAEYRPAFELIQDDEERLGRDK